MCRFCDWGDMYPEESPQDGAAGAADSEERQRNSRDLWSKLMEELNQADAAKSADDPPANN
jgi:hypothetical protein